MVTGLLLAKLDPPLFPDPAALAQNGELTPTFALPRYKIIKSLDKPPFALAEHKLWKV